MFLRHENVVNVKNITWFVRIAAYIFFPRLKLAAILSIMFGFKTTQKLNEYFNSISPFDPLIKNF